MFANWRLMFALFMDVFRFSPSTMISALIFTLCRSISAGVGLLLIIPLLQVIGLAIGPKETYGITTNLTLLFNKLHVPHTLPTILISYVLMMSLVASAAYAEQIISTKLQQNYIHHLRGVLYSRIAHANWAFFLQQKVSHLLHGLTTQIQMISNANFQLLTLINNMILLCVYVALTFLLSWQMTCLAVVCGFLLLSMMLPLHKLTSQSGKHHLKYNQDIMQTMAEQLSAMKMIKGSGFETTFVNETLLISTSLEQQNKHLIQVTALSKLLYTMGSIIIFSMLLYVAIHVLTLPLPSLLLLLLVFSRILPMVSMIQQSYQRMLHQLPAYCDIRTLLNHAKAAEEKSHEAELSLPFNQHIALKNISFSYPSKPDCFIIQNLSLTIKKNTTTAIIGPSGIGKSTLADIIVGLLEPTAGEIFIDNQLLDAQHKVAWRRSVAYVTQDNFLFNASIRHNLQLLCGLQSDNSLWTALKAAAAADFVAALSQGLDTEIGDRGVRLSGGERQRIALARALLAKPKLLILDESTNALDTQTISEIQQILKQLQGKMTILIISHQMDMSNFADEKIVLPIEAKIISKSSTPRDAVI